MTTRLLWFFFTLCLGGILGYAFAAPAAHIYFAVAFGVVIAALLFFAGDIFYARRLSQALTLDAAWPSQAPKFHGIYHDIWARMDKKMRLKSREVESATERLREFLHAMQQSPIGVTMLGSDNRIRWVNKLAASHFGINPGRDQEQIITNLIRNPDFAAYMAKPSKDDLLLDGQVSGTKLAVHVHDYSGLGRDQRRLLISRDVSSLLQAEAMRRDFVANVSHEIATPLTVLSGFIETMQTTPTDAATQEKMLGLMHTQAERMQHLLKDLLVLSKLEASPPPNNQQKHDVADLFDECQADAEQLLRTLKLSHQLHFGFAPKGSKVLLAGSRAELLSAFNNLVQNAIFYTPDGGEIRVDWQMDEQGQGIFQVKDTGPGIAAEHIARLTERFYRADSSRSRETGGTGLGLSIVKHVAQRHDAQLRIDSQLFVGSVFALCFAPHKLTVMTDKTA